MAPSRSSPVTRKRKRVQGLKVVNGALLGKKAAAPESSEVKAGTGEAFARQAVEKGGLISQASVTKALSWAQVPMQARQNVVPKGERSVQGMGCGLYVYGDRIGVTASTSRFPWLARLLAAFGRQAHPNFAFTSIQVNVNYAARPHVDRNNLGQSQIIGLGDYTGGELWVHDDVGQVPLTLDEDIKQEALYRSGTMWRGSEIDIRGKWLEFTGNRLHYTRAFDGTRYSLVYYTCDRYAIATPEVRAELRGAGFAFSWRSDALRKLVASKRRDRDQRRRFFTQKAAAGRRFGQHLADDDEVVNPKLPGSAAHKRYNKYLRARTVGEARRLGCFPIDLQYDFNWGYLQVSGLRPEPSEWDVEISDSSWTARPPVPVAETAASSSSSPPSGGADGAGTGTSGGGGGGTPLAPLLQTLLAPSLRAARGLSRERLRITVLPGFSMLCWASALGFDSAAKWPAPSTCFLVETLADDKNDAFVRVWHLRDLWELRPAWHRGDGPVAAPPLGAPGAGPGQGAEEQPGGRADGDRR
eukprot:CAMPEP_0177246294 /NCGR_PEP_ID=MMETSP0367-20130122/50929_1 /TAXON_ID=447022 ORGANISM="Scrippsiella hangoei-like, Strain SHHI-4" /NCGR_SAMPLE_ID=MMETSP0367 /ASSEMBLY_ACC=CAM_ASM_000362 /LENGTH=526 /DNA_ID=CAMNT_0018698297 /DNA_START=63 /DNA_END=1640 /DNA_ORIENTATION=-